MRVERSRLAALAARLGHAGTPRVYTDRNPLVRELFWRRLGALLAMSAREPRRRALDFGGGNGVLLPSLSRLYDEVWCVDLRAEMAEELARIEGLLNVRALSAELLALDLPAAHFDTIFAADVLEHVAELDPLAGEFSRLLVPDGELLVSCPSENRFYELGRRACGYARPKDHYHPAGAVEETLARHLTLDRRRYFPLDWAPLGVFFLARFVRRG